MEKDVKKMLLKKYAKAYKLAESYEDKFEIILKVIELDPTLEEVIGVTLDDVEYWDVWDVYNYMEDNKDRLNKLFGGK